MLLPVEDELTTGLQEYSKCFLQSFSMVYDYELDQKAKGKLRDAADLQSSSTKSLTSVLVCKSLFEFSVWDIY